MLVAILLGVVGVLKCVVIMPQSYERSSGVGPGHTRYPLLWRKCDLQCHILTRAGACGFVRDVVGNELHLAGSLHLGEIHSKETPRKPQVSHPERNMYPVRERQ